MRINLDENIEALYNMDDEGKIYIAQMSKIKEDLLKHIIPESYPEKVCYFSSMLTLLMHPELMREEFINISSFPLISKDWLKLLAEYIGKAKCVEIMAGSGMLSFGLKEFGIDIIATDDFSWKNKWENWTSIEKLDCIDAIKKYAKERPYIIMSWPLMDDTAYRTLLTLRKINPKGKIIFIGEFGDCCASEEFCEAAVLIDEMWSKKINEKFLSWRGIHDLLLILK